MGCFRRRLADIGLLIALPLALLGQSVYDSAITKARALLNEKKVEEAVAVSEQAIQMDEKRWEGYLVAASAYSAEGLFDDAIGMLQAALMRAPQEKKPAVRDAIAEIRRLLNASAAATQPVQPSVAVAMPAAATGPAVQAAAPTQSEVLLWKTIENSKSPDDYKAYLQQYPNGTFAVLASSRIEAIEREKRAAVSKVPPMPAAAHPKPAAAPQKK